MRRSLGLIGLAFVLCAASGSTDAGAPAQHRASDQISRLIWQLKTRGAAEHVLRGSTAAELVRLIRLQDRETLDELDPASIDMLVEMLWHYDPTLRFAAAEILEQLGPSARRALPAVRSLLDYESLAQTTVRGPFSFGETFVTALRRTVLAIEAP